MFTFCFIYFMHFYPQNTLKKKLFSSNVEKNIDLWLTLLSPT